MKIQIKKLPKSKIELEIEVPAQEFDEFINKATFNLGKDVEIEGFRKGKAPKEIIVRAMGLEKILNEAAELCVKEKYIRAILENKIEALGQPEIEILKIAPSNSFIFRAKSAVLPEIRLGDYKKIASAIKRKEVKIEDKEVEDTLDWLRKNHATKSGQGLPEINDDWARGFGKFENLAALKKNIKDGLNLEKEALETQRVRREIAEKISEKSEMEAPEILIEAELKNIIERLKIEAPQVLQISFEDYLKKISKTEKELMDSSLSEAEKRVRSSLILREIGKQENIQVSEEEIKQEINQILKHYPDAGKAEKEIDPEKLKLYIEGELKREKTFQLLESYSKSL